MLRRLFLKLGVAKQQPTVRTLSPQCPLCKNFVYTDPATAKYFIVSNTPDSLSPSVYPCYHVNICPQDGIVFLSKKTTDPCPPIAFNLQNNRTYGTVLSWNAIDNGWILPPTATNVVVSCNGRRLINKSSVAAGKWWDYEVIPNLVKPNSTTPPEVAAKWEIFFDFDLG